MVFKFFKKKEELTFLQRMESLLGKIIDNLMTSTINLREEILHNELDIKSISYINIQLKHLRNIFNILKTRNIINMEKYENISTPLIFIVGKEEVLLNNVLDKKMKLLNELFFKLKTLKNEESIEKTKAANDDNYNKPELKKVA
jgi:hypothetical protein